MKIIVETEILEAVKRVKPIKIAVAYIGQDWESFIPNLNLLKEVIVSPTFGSNPEAVVNLAKRIGWDNVYFLNELHAKF